MDDQTFKSLVAVATFLILAITAVVCMLLGIRNLSRVAPRFPAQGTYTLVQEQDEAREEAVPILVQADPVPAQAALVQAEPVTVQAPVSVAELHPKRIVYSRRLAPGLRAVMHPAKVGEKLMPYLERIPRMKNGNTYLLKRGTRHGWPSTGLAENELVMIEGERQNRPYAPVVTFQSGNHDIINREYLGHIEQVPETLSGVIKKVYVGARNTRDKIDPKDPKTSRGSNSNLPTDVMGLIGAYAYGLDPSAVTKRVSAPDTPPKRRASRRNKSVRR
jgi:hypothetical protein